MNILEIPLRTIDGASTDLGAFAGKVMLIVNVASQCGLTPQYEALEALYKKYQGRGLIVVGFPANDFGSQEPGTDEEILNFCTTSFGVTFPMFSKIEANGDGRHPMYEALIEKQPTATFEPDSGFKEKLAQHGIVPASESDILWNFEKFVVDRKGDVVGRFAPDVTPDSPMLVAAIEEALAR